VRFVDVAVGQGLDVKVKAIAKEATKSGNRCMHILLKHPPHRVVVPLRYASWHEVSEETLCPTASVIVLCNLPHTCISTPRGGSRGKHPSRGAAWRRRCRGCSQLLPTPHRLPSTRNVKSTALLPGWAAVFSVSKLRPLA
jgi:hypothetical protein